MLRFFVLELELKCLMEVVGNLEFVFDLVEVELVVLEVLVELGLVQGLLVVEQLEELEVTAKF